MAEVSQRILAAADGARGAVILLSPNPLHDTGGGQRSAQVALELLERNICVVFVAHGEVTETVDLGLSFPHPRLVELPLAEWTGRTGRRALAALLARARTVGITQIPVRAWLPTLRRIRRSGGVTVFDLIDRWSSELGGRWYRPRVEARIARASDVLIASAPILASHLESLARRPAHIVPNAFNDRIFRSDLRPPRPSDLPEGRAIALYVGSLWGGWMDWALVRAMATRLPEIAFVFVGDYRGEGGTLPPNCHFLGLKPQTRLPEYLAYADLGFLPWRVSPITRATSPLKVYEYVAMGLPVVAPPLEPLAGIPGVEGAPDEAAFIAGVEERAGQKASPALRAEMRAFARANSWSARVDRLLTLVRLGHRTTPEGTGEDPSSGEE